MVEPKPYRVFYIARKLGMPNRNASPSFRTAEEARRAIAEIREWKWELLEIRKNGQILTEAQLDQDAGRLSSA